MAVGGGRRIVVEFLGKDTSLGRTANDVDGKVSRLGGRMSKVGNVAGKALAGGFLIAGAAAVKAGKAAAEDEASQSKLEQTLRKAAGATDSQVASTEKWITAQGKALGVSDDELRPALSKLAVATGDVGEAQKLAALGMDISAGSGKSLESVSAALAKAQNGNVAGLARLGVRTKDAQGKTKSLKEITKDLADTYSGAASKAAETTAGKQKKLTVQMGELQEKIGEKLLPVMSDLTDKGLETIDWMTKHSKTVKIVGGLLVGLVGTLWTVSKVVKAVTVVQAALNLVMSANPIGLVVLAIAALVAGLVIAYKRSETFRKIVDGAFKGVAAAAKFMWEGVIKPVFRFITTAWLNVAGAIINGAAHAFGWVPGLGPKLRKAAAWFNDFKKDVNAALDGTKDKKKITISTPGADTAISNLATIKRLMHDIRSAKPQKVPTGGGLLGAGLGSNAKGTNNWRGGPTWVGEKGPEILNLPRGSRITPNNKSMAAVGGGNATAYATINLNLDGKTVQQVLLRLKRTNGGLELGLA